MSCSRPFFEMLARGDLLKWVTCPYAIDGLTVTGVGMMIVITGFVGLKNWSESWTVPMVWVAIVSPAMAAALLPGVLLRRIAGLVTVAVAFIIIGVYWWWGRS